MAGTPKTLTSLDDLTGAYAAILCDVWGVVHNGIRPFAAACEALRRARGHGLPVILVTNAPRLRGEVAAFIDRLGVPRDCWDELVTSGDVTRDLVASGPRRIFHLGLDADRGLYDGLDVELVEDFEASAVVCTGLFDDENEDPSDYAEMLRRFRMRDLPFICANPDIQVERGDKLVWCAGALARDYAQLGGRTMVAGKPHRPIYDAALKIAGEVTGRDIPAHEVLAIGDGVLTDVKGAIQNGLDALFITGGIHAGEYGEAERPDPGRLAAFLERHGMAPLAAMPRLA